MSTNVITPPGSGVVVVMQDDMDFILAADGPAALAVYLRISQGGYLTTRQIAEDTHLSLRTIHHKIRSLERLGLLEVIRRKGEYGQVLTNLYRVKSVANAGGAGRGDYAE